jgi:hypothetical protein
MQKEAHRMLELERKNEQHKNDDRGIKQQNLSIHLRMGRRWPALPAAQASFQSKAAGQLAS